MVEDGRTGCNALKRGSARTSAAMAFGGAAGLGTCGVGSGALRSEAPDRAGEATGTPEVETSAATCETSRSIPRRGRSCAISACGARHCGES